VQVVRNDGQQFQTRILTTDRTDEDEDREQRENSKEQRKELSRPGLKLSHKEKEDERSGKIQRGV
jgi:hypothetical protein